MVWRASEDYVASKLSPICTGHIGEGVGSDFSEGEIFEILILKEMILKGCCLRVKCLTIHFFRLIDIEVRITTKVAR